MCIRDRDDTAYPDIDLPDKVMSGDRVPKFNPDFYYFKSFPKNEERRDLKAIDKIIKESNAFKEDVRNHIVTNRPLELGEAKPVELTDRGTINTKTGGSEPIIGRQEVSFDDELSNENHQSIRVNDIPLSAERFTDASQLTNYIANKKAEIKNKVKLSLIHI